MFQNGITSITRSLPGLEGNEQDAGVVSTNRGKGTQQKRVQENEVRKAGSGLPGYFACS
jgi:hypothetical protein